MKIVFIGGCYPDNFDKHLQQYCKEVSISIPSNIYQRAIIEGLVDNGADIHVITYPYLPGYPSNYRLLYSPNAPFILNGKHVGEMRRYCLFSLIKGISIRVRLEKSLFEWAENNINLKEEVVLISYSPSISQLIPAINLKKRYPRIKVCCIITDLFYQDFSQLRGLPFLKKIQHGKEILSLKKLLPKIDKYVLLAKGIELLVPFAKDRNIIIEGISSRKNLRVKNNVDSKEKILLYTGSLDMHSSIKELVDAFILTSDPNFRLYICGVGCYENYVKEASKKDSRIVFMGLIQHEDVLKLQYEATALINPRYPSIKDTPFSFPSKTMEYLSSGTPMIGYKLDGIPAEYYPYYFTIEKEGLELMAAKIIEVLSMRQVSLNHKAKEAHEFIMKNKTSFSQARKLLEFLAH